MRRAAQAVEAREIDRLVVAGQTRPQIVFEIMGRAGELSAEQIALRAHYSEGLAAYRARHWDEATSALKAALAAAPGDGPCMVLLARVESLRDNPPPADWDGSWRLDQKRMARPVCKGGLSRLAADPVCINVSGLEELPPAMMEIRTLRSS